VLFQRPGVMAHSLKMLLINGSQPVVHGPLGSNP